MNFNFGDVSHLYASIVTSSDAACVKWLGLCNIFVPVSLDVNGWGDALVSSWDYSARIDFLTG